MTLTGVESVRPSRAGSLLAIAPEADLATTKVVSGVRGVAVNLDGSTPEATLAKMSCPASRHSTATATTNRLIDILHETDLPPRVGKPSTPDLRGLGVGDRTSPPTYGSIRSRASRGWTVPGRT